MIFIGGPGTGSVGQVFSYLMATKWSVDAMKISSDIPYNVAADGFGATDLLIRWDTLLRMTAVLLTVTAWQISRRGSV